MLTDFVVAVFSSPGLLNAYYLTQSRQWMRMTHFLEACCAQSTLCDGLTRSIYSCLTNKDQTSWYSTFDPIFCHNTSVSADQ